MQGHRAKRVSFAEVEVTTFGAASLFGVCQQGFEYRFQLARRARNDAQHLGGCCLLLQRLGKLLPSLGELGPRFGEPPSACVEFLFQFGPRLVRPSDVRSRLRSGRTKLAAACWTICAFVRQGHLVGTVTGPPPGRPSQGWSLSARASSVGGISRPSARAALSTALPAGRRAFPPSGRDPHRFQADGRYPVCSGRSSCRQLEAALHSVSQCCLPLAIHVAMRAQCELVHTGLGRRKKPQPVDGRGKLSRADGEARVRPFLLCIDWSRTLLSRLAHVRGLVYLRQRFAR